jgi:hypothetical protein
LEAVNVFLNRESIMTRLSALWGLLLFALGALGDITGNFTFPTTEGITIELGASINITWTLTDPTSEVNLWMSQYDHDNIAQSVVGKSIPADFPL